MTDAHRARGGLTRRQVLAPLAGATLWIPLSGRALAQSPTPAMPAEIAFSQAMFATPHVLWSSDTELTMAGVFGVSSRQGRMVKVVQFDRRGREVDHYPASAGPMGQVNPGRAVLGIGASGGAMLIGADGHIVSRSASGAERRLSRVPDIAMPVAVWRTDRSRPDATFVVSTEFKGPSTSQNALAILRDGVPMDGFPMALAAAPEAGDPAIDWTNARGYLALTNGVVDGIDLRSARRLPGFPVTLPRERGRPVSGHRLVLTPRGDALLVTMRRGRPVRIELDAQRPPRVLGTGEAASGGQERIWALSRVDERVLVGFDCATNRLVVLDEGGTIRSSIPHPLTTPHDGAHLACVGRHLLCVGTSARAEDDAVSALFEARAPQDIKDKVADLANRHALRKAGTAVLNDDQLAERDRSVLEMKRSWLENNHGLLATNAAVQAEQFVSVQSFLVDASGLRASGEPQRLRSMTDATGVQANAALAPTLVMDTQREPRGFFVGANRVDPYGKSNSPARALGLFVPLTA